jgi:DNA-binding response OmpR family regulator
VTAESPSTIAGTRILVVDDTEELADILSFVLTREGADVEVARDGQVAVERALADDFGVVLMDVGLPIIDGLEACRRITSERPGTRVVMLSARDSVADREAGTDAGAIGYLSKPFGPRTLVADLLAVLAAADRLDDAGG